MKLQVLLTKNDNLLQKFPKDPDYDVTIICNDLKFKLQMAFLYLESKTFDYLYHQKEKQIELNQLDEQALEKVLMVLYGGEITIKSFQNLTKIYAVINYLKIDTLKDNIIEQLKEQFQDIFSIEMIEFCYQNSLLISQVSTLLFNNDLEVFRDPKHSMELNRVSEQFLNVILLEYFKKSTNPDKEQVRNHISGILSDYFHINKKKPEDYFSKYNVEDLQLIWHESHPLYYSQNMYGSNNSVHSTQAKTIETLEEKIKNLKLAVKQKQEKIRSLMQQNFQIKQKQKQKQRVNAECFSLHNRIPQHFSLQPAKSTFTDLINKPPSLPPTPPNRGQYLVQDDEYQPNKKIYVTQMKTKQGINKIHTRNNSRSKNE